MSAASKSGKRAEPTAKPSKTKLILDGPGLHGQDQARIDALFREN
jgi:hypothetical protein